VSGRDDLDAPKPPGGPQRTDAPQGDDTPGTPAQDPGPDTKRVTRPDDSGPVPPPTGDDSHPDSEETELQQENAGTSLDQPSG